MASTHAQRKALGDYGERMAARHLVGAGYRILDRNWRCPDGELDIVALVGDVVVACEVKTRTSERHGTPLEAVNPKKAARLRRLIVRWAREHGVGHATLRVDVVCVLRPVSGAATIAHLIGVC